MARGESQLVRAPWHRGSAVVCESRRESPPINRIPRRISFAKSGGGAPANDSHDYTVVPHSHVAHFQGCHLRTKWSRQARHQGRLLLSKVRSQLKSPQGTLSSAVWHDGPNTNHTAIRNRSPNALAYYGFGGAGFLGSVAGGLDAAGTLPLFPVKPFLTRCC